MTRSTRARLVVAGLSLVVSVPVAAQVRAPARAATVTSEQAALLDLSEKKWRWMSDKQADSLAGLFHPEAVFVHMGGTMPRTQELDVIRSGGIHYKTIDIEKSSARLVGNSTAIVLSTMVLGAVVGGNTVSNPFEVTEVFVRDGATWKLGALSFTRLLRP
jgi:hypothetical protein